MTNDTTPSYQDRLKEIEERLQLFHDHIEEKKIALIEGRPYSASLAMAANEVILVTEHIPWLLSQLKARDEQLAVAMEAIEDGICAMEAYNSDVTQAFTKELKNAKSVLSHLAPPPSAS